MVMFRVIKGLLPQVSLLCQHYGGGRHLLKKCVLMAGGGGCGGKILKIALLFVSWEPVVTGLL